MEKAEALKALFQKLYRSVRDELRLADWCDDWPERLEGLLSDLRKELEIFYDDLKQLVPGSFTDYVPFSDSLQAGRDFKSYIKCMHQIDTSAARGWLNKYLNATKAYTKGHLKATNELIKATSDEGWRR